MNTGLQVKPFVTKFIGIYTICIQVLIPDLVCAGERAKSEIFNLIVHQLSNSNIPSGFYKKRDGGSGGSSYYGFIDGYEIELEHNKDPRYFRITGEKQFPINSTDVMGEFGELKQFIFDKMYSKFEGEVKIKSYNESSWNDKEAKCSGHIYKSGYMLNTFGNGNEFEINYDKGSYTVGPCPYGSPGKTPSKVTFSLFRKL